MSRQWNNCSQERIRIDIHRGAGGAGQFQLAEPGRHIGRQIHLARGGDEEAQTVTSAKDADWGRGWAIHRDAVTMRRWDEYGKVPGLQVPGFDAYRSMLRGQMKS